MSHRYPRIDDIVKAKEVRPSPAHYDVKDGLIRSTRYSKIHVGGYSPKDPFKSPKYPGPGEYDTFVAMADKHKRNSNNLSSTFAS